MSNLNLSGIANATTAAGALFGLILVSPQKTTGYQPQNFPSWTNDTSALPPSILFNYEGEQTATFTSDITDHFIEDNTSVQDQIALKPIMVTTQGFVGELNTVAPVGLQTLKVVAEKLVSIGAYTPEISTTAQIAYNEAFFAYQLGASAVTTAVSAWGTLNGGSGESVINGSGINAQSNQTQQQKYFQQFYGYWAKRTLFTIQTPWAIFQDMAIMSLRAVQDAETDKISDFEVSFKQMRFASTALLESNLNPAGFSSRLLSQGASLVNLGTNTLTSSPLSFAAAL